jgi:hypothetical protein
VRRRGLALGHLRQHGIDGRLQCDDQTGDGVGAAHQIADEAFEIVDQPPLVARHSGRFGLLKLDPAGDAGHEGLRVLGKAFENAHEIAQIFVDLGGIGLLALNSQRMQGL